MNGQNHGWHVGEELRSGLWFKKVAYLLLSFPLGIVYFVFLVTGFSLGIGLAILVVGVFILAGVLAVAAALGRFERVLNKVLLEIPVPVTGRAPVPPREGLVAKLKHLFSNPFAWTSTLYLLLKFPFGLLSFTLALTLIVTSIALILMPLFVGIVPVQFDDNLFWSVDTFEEALLAALAGVILAGVSVFVLSGLATLWGHFAGIMLKERGAAARIAPDARPVVID
jgi:hypothetical protein